MPRHPGLAALAGLALAALGGVCVGCGGAVAAVPDAEVPVADAGRDAGAGAVCVDFAPGAELGRVGPRALAEISGVVASRAHEGVLWVHNDSGGGARVFAIDTTGALRGEWVLDGASAADWEDIAIERVAGGGPDRLWIGDVGDNAARDGATGRSHVVVLRIDEPALPAEPGPITLTEIDAIVLRYPDRPRDCEAIAVDGETGDLYVLAKENDGPSDVFVARGPLAGGEERVLERMATIESGSMVTGADFSPDGRELLVRTYRSVLWWRREIGETWAAALGRAARGLPRAPEPQGESVAFAQDGEGYFTISEGESAPIWFYERRCD